jgi:ribosome biogenesis protein SSF1/2
MRLANCRRVVLINYNTDSDTIDFRHYEISAVPVGLTKGIRKIIKGKLVDLHSRDDIADYVDNPNTMSDSEAELPEDARVTLSQSVHGRGNLKQQTSAIKLKELGPRMTLQLFKIEEGLFEGNVMYHKFVTKTEEEAMAIAQRREAKRAEKEGRKNEQEANVLRKQQEQEAREKLKNEKRAAREAARALIAKDEYDESDSDSDSEEEVEPDYKHTGPVDMDDEDDEEDGEMAFDDEDDDDNSEGKVIEFDDDEEEEESEESEPAPKKGRFNKRK